MTGPVEHVDVEAFDRDGFLSIDGLARTEELPALRDAYADILAGRVEAGALDRRLGNITRQVMMPHLLHPALGAAPVIERARRIAGEIMAFDQPDVFFSMLIDKPPEHPHETPWHQDLAYGGTPFAPEGASVDNASVIQFWLALEDVDADMGCMEFSAGVHNRPLPKHKVASGAPDDDGRLLAIETPETVIDPASVIVCPLKAGGATAHGYMTPHRTGPNRSKTRGRPAFIFSFVRPDFKTALAGAA